MLVSRGEAYCSRASQPSAGHACSPRVLQHCKRFPGESSIPARVCRGPAYPSVFLIVWTCLRAAARRLRSVRLVVLVYGGLAVLGSMVFMVNVSSIKGGKPAPLVGLMFCAGAAVFILGVAVILLGYRVLKASRGNC